jgi:hypothetical protein
VVGLHIGLQSKRGVVLLLVELVVRSENASHHVLNNESKH